MKFPNDMLASTGDAKSKYLMVANTGAKPEKLTVQELLSLVPVVDLTPYALTTTSDGKVVRTPDGKIDLTGKVDKNVIYNITQHTGITYSDKTTARNAVTATLRGLGQIIAYKLTSGWVTEQYIGTDVSGWATEANWKVVGGATSADIANATKPIVDFQKDVESTLLITLDYTSTNALGGTFVIDNKLLQANGNYSVVSGATIMNWKLVPTDQGLYRITKLDFTFARFGGSTNHANLIGVKDDGSIVALVRGSGSPATGTAENAILDVSAYKYLSISHSQSDVSKEALNLKIYGENNLDTNNVKRYINYTTSPLTSFFNQPLFSDKTLITVSSTTTDTFGGVYSPNTILQTNNFAGGTSILSKTWLNVPTSQADGSVITKCVFFVKRYGGVATGVSNANFLGIRKDGTINEIIRAVLSTSSGDEEIHEIDTTGYEKISFSFSVNTDAAIAYNRLQIFKSTISLIHNKDVREYINASISDSKPVRTKTLLRINRPNTMPFVNITGVLPTDTSDDRTPTDVELEYGVDNSVIFKCPSRLAIQGNATALLAKKGYECALTNYVGAELKVQFGGWIPCSEFHLKSYPNDQTFSRDVTAGKLWHKIRQSRNFPESYIANFNAGQTTDAHKENLQEQALFFTDGFPIELRLNGAFYGLYVLRLKKERDNYMINNANANHIFLDNEEGINWTTYTPSNWKIRSPKTQDQALTDKLNRWWTWFEGIQAKTIDFESTAASYINIGSWVDALILQQLSGHWDYQINNMLLLSWDGLTISICYYDGDQTWGWMTSSNAYLTIDSDGLYWRGTFFRNTIYPGLKTRIQERWTYLRKNGIITMNNIYNTFRESTDVIPRDLSEKEFSAWAVSSPNVGKHNLRYSLNWANNRLTVLDKIWLIN